jgi:predicted acylesterase/phospholipase RssA
MRQLGLTFAGGGNRSFYQQGLFDVWGDKLWPHVAAVAGVSAGSAIATLMLSGRADQARQHWDVLRRDIHKNLDVTRLLRGQPLAPHGRIYHSTMCHAFENGGLEAIRALPFPVFILCAIPPSKLPIALSTWLGLLGYAVEKKLDPRKLHPKAGHRLGFRPLLVDARTCSTPRELADLVLASSATPPFTPVGSFDRQRLLDGGLIDNAPAEQLERQHSITRNLVLLTRPYPEGVTGVRGRRLYLAPTGPVPVSRWDYTHRAPIDQTRALGREDAARHALTLDRWLNEVASPPSLHARVGSVALQG